LLVVDHGARRLLPLAALFRLALVFPDRAPSRYRLALRTGTVRQLTDRLRDGGDLGDTPAEAAENLIVLITALGRHDRRSRGHSERVRAYSDLIGAELGLPAADRQLLHWAALVHDVGKIHVRPEVLNKPGRPDEDEWRELRSHPAHAEAMLAPLRPWLGGWVDAATQHHERIDGRGYPKGLRGHETSLAGLIVAVADAYDCMTSARSYKKPLPAAQARYELTRNSGTQFDAEVVRALLRVSVGRLHLAAGPLSWLAQFPGFREGVTVASGAGAPASALVGSAAVITAAAFGGLAVPSAGVSSAVAAEPAPTSTEVVVDQEPDEGGQDSGGPRVVDDSDAAGRPSATPTTQPVLGGTPEPTDGDQARPDDRPRPPGATPTPTTVTSSPPATTAPASTTTTTTTRPTTTTAPVPTTTTTAPANLPPVAVADSRSVGLLSTTFIAVLTNDHDPDGSLDPTTLEITSGPSVGSAVVSSGRIRYTAPLLGFSTQVGYRICDDDGACAQANLSITITLL
jgi:hypothetical protein